MKTLLLLAGLALLSAPVPARACEPIVPFIKAVGGPGGFTLALIALGVVVLLKSAAFARFQTKLTFTKALLWMLAANVVTSIIGLVVPAMIDKGGILLVAVPLVWAFCLLPADRLLSAAPVSVLARFTRTQLAFGLTLVLVVSYILFLMSTTVHNSASFALYWMVKVFFIYAALAIGIALTAFWEEWIVLRLSRSEDQDLSFVQPVIRANLIVLLGVMLVSTAFMIPMRFKKPDLVASGQTKAAVDTPKPSPAKN